LATRRQLKEENTTSRKPLVIAAAFWSVAGLSLAIQVRASGDKVPFPENYAAGLLYNTVDRYDVKQYREQYATFAAIDAVRNGQAIPSGTVITMIEYKAQVDAQGKPIKDSNGHFVKGDLAPQKTCHGHGTAATTITSMSIPGRQKPVVRQARAGGFAGSTQSFQTEL